MSSISKTDQLSARVSVKVPRPDSLVEVRVTPPDSNFQVKVSPGEDVIELLIRPGASMVEVRISPPGQREIEDEGDLDSAWVEAPPEDDSAGGPGQNAALPNQALSHFKPYQPPCAAGDRAEASAADEVLPGVSQAEFAAMVEEEESAEARKLLDQMAEDEAAPAAGAPSSGYSLPDEVQKILASDPDDEDELNRLDEVLSLEEDPVEAEVAPEEAEAQELSPDQAAEILPEAPEEVADDPASFPVEEAAVQGPSPEDLADSSYLSQAEADGLDQLAVAGPAPEELTEVIAPAEVDEFDLPDEAADEEEAVQAAAAAVPDEAEPDEFDLPELAEAADEEEAVQAAAPTVPDEAEPDEFDLPDLAEPADEEEAVQAAAPTVPDEAEPDEFDLPELAEPADEEEAVHASATAVPDEAEPDEFDLPELAEPSDEETVQAAASTVPDEAEPDEFDLPELAEAADEEAAQAAGVPDEAEPDEFDLPELAEVADEEAAQTAAPARSDEVEAPMSEDPFEALTLEDEIVPPAKPAAAGPQATSTPAAKPSASQTLEWVPVNPNGTPLEEDEPIAPEVIGAAALDALANLNLAVQEEQAAIEAASRPETRPRPGEATASAASYFASADSTFTSADSTIMVEMYDDYEPGPNPADTMTPPPEDELMDLSQVEKDEDLAIDPIDVDGLGELDLDKSHFAETRNGAPTIKARPMIQVIPGNTVVPE